MITFRFAIQAVLFLIIGAWADYGSWRPNITIAFTIVAVAVSFAWLGVTDPAKWEAGVALYILGCKPHSFAALRLMSNSQA